MFAHFLIVVNFLFSRCWFCIVLLPLVAAPVLVRNESLSGNIRLFANDFAVVHVHTCRQIETMPTAAPKHPISFSINFSTFASFKNVVRSVAGAFFVQKCWNFRHHVRDTSACTINADARFGSHTKLIYFSMKFYRIMQKCENGICHTLDVFELCDNSPFPYRTQSCSQSRLTWVNKCGGSRESYVSNRKLVVTT